MEQRNQSVVAMTDHCMKFSKAKMTTKSNATAVACIFLERWICNYGILSEALTDNSPEILSKYFVAFCSTLADQDITNINYDM